jgi:hypothetical protein
LSKEKSIHSTSIFTAKLAGLNPLLKRHIAFCHKMNHR